MAIEPKRGCGYRKVDGLYLIGGSLSLPCDRLPYPLRTCPVCGAGIRVGRAFTEINPLALFHSHGAECNETIGKCPVCQPTTAPGYIMLVGERFYPTPQHFVAEGISQGISKRIPFIPKSLEIGQTVIYLAHKDACKIESLCSIQRTLDVLHESIEQPQLLDAAVAEPELGIFATFVPTRIEKICRESERGSDQVIALEKRGITPVYVPDGDPDHDPD